MRRTTARTFLHRAWCAVLGTARAASCSLGISVAVAAGLTAGLVAAPAAAYAQQGDSDMIVLRNGTKLYGKIVSETATSIKFRGQIAGIELETEYQKSDLTEIQRGVANPDAAAAAGAAASGAFNPPGAAADIAPPTDGKARVYWVELKGDFGQQISQTPIREALLDAKKNYATHIIFELDANWTVTQFGEKEEALDAMAAFDQIFRAEPMAALIADEAPRLWSPEPMPKVIFWVKKAMAGAALLPWVSENIYMSSDGRIGGVGNLSYMLRGHERVVEKQLSLRLGHFEGWARVGKHDERLIRAMARIEDVLSVKIVDGKPVLLERLPQDESEELLTDSGMGQYADSMEDVVRNEGNDSLTLRARTAALVGVSKGTVDTRDELLALENIPSDYIDVSARSKRIMDTWARRLDDGKRNLRKKWEEFGELYPARARGETSRERNANRGRCIRLLDEIKSQYKRIEEGIDPMFVRMYGIPDEPQINTIQEQLRLEILGDNQR